jgi:hypothetical protein
MNSDKPTLVIELFTPSKGFKQGTVLRRASLDALPAGSENDGTLLAPLLSLLIGRAVTELMYNHIVLSDRLDISLQNVPLTHKDALDDAVNILHRIALIAEVPETAVKVTPHPRGSVRVDIVYSLRFSADVCRALDLKPYSLVDASKP